MTTQFNRPAIYISLGLSIVLVIGVLFGTKYYFENVARQPVSVSAVDSPEASSPLCEELVANLPERFMGEKRSELVEPAPDGVAAWADISSMATVLRCGVDMPLQYTEYSQPVDIDGSNWLEVRDMTEGSSLTTWYNTDFSPAVAVTTHTDKQPEGLSDALEVLDATAQEPRPAPLSQLSSADNAEVCASLDDALPDTLGEDYQRMDVSEEHTAAWSAAGREPVAIRCGVEPPAGYEAGEQLQQINDIPWFQDTTLGEGTTAGTWYALGRETDIAVSAPQDIANTALVELGDVIVANTKEQD
ncbi:DUF3515 domain-containing protein [Corynebacterium ammoniagenes]|uniref:DUF3515 domain-containing protein n=1 Tax=Corynebacterium ammoniagenes TaxID=1697 RepID=A0AAV5G8K9_CORAM|nr:DUF3515 domain-containing protein [Corynebacterium ammoniagenes]GJN42968.1 hypothetical protein CAT723_14470 [Corynebacterium ammoniagenes]